MNDHIEMLLDDLIAEIQIDRFCGDVSDELANEAILAIDELW